jgi:hypothetical protein
VRLPHAGQVWIVDELQRVYAISVGGQPPADPEDVFTDLAAAEAAVWVDGGEPVLLILAVPGPQGVTNTANSSSGRSTVGNVW